MNRLLEDKPSNSAVTSYRLIFPCPPSFQDSYSTPSTMRFEAITLSLVSLFCHTLAVPAYSPRPDTFSEPRPRGM
jgi:hypothetical protein